MMFRKHEVPSNERLRELPLVKAPDSIWASIEAAVNTGERPRSARLLRRSWWPAFVVASLLIASGVYWEVTHGAKPRWEVVRLEGTPSIGSRRFGETSLIAEGQWLETDAASKAIIHVGSIGTVQVDSNSRVRVVAARATEHRLALAHGRISASVTAPPRLFFVDTSSSTAVDLGCAYTMDVDDAGNGLVQVTLGWVSLERNGRESLVPAGASCRIRAKMGPGTPFFDDAPVSLEQALIEIDFEKGGSGALETVLSSARERDTLTLWHLLSRVGRTDRLRVYARMVALVPLPNGISPAKALQLDRETLKHWREELAWKW
jgi:FecR protein